MRLLVSTPEPISEPCAFGPRRGAGHFEFDVSIIGVIPRGEYRTDGAQMPLAGVHGRKKGRRATRRLLQTPPRRRTPTGQRLDEYPLSAPGPFLWCDGGCRSGNLAVC